MLSASNRNNGFNRQAPPRSDQALHASFVTLPLNKARSKLGSDKSRRIKSRRGTTPARRLLDRNLSIPSPSKTRCLQKPSHPASWMTTKARICHSARTLSSWAPKNAPAARRCLRQAGVLRHLLPRPAAAKLPANSIGSVPTRQILREDRPGSGSGSRIDPATSLACRCLPGAHAIWRNGRIPRRSVKHRRILPMSVRVQFPAYARHSNRRFRRAPSRR